MSPFKSLLDGRLLLRKYQLTRKDRAITEKMARLESACSPKLTRVLHMSVNIEWEKLLENVKNISSIVSCRFFKRHQGKSFTISVFEKRKTFCCSTMLCMLESERLLVRVEKIRPDYNPALFLSALCNIIRQHVAKKETAETIDCERNTIANDCTQKSDDCCAYDGHCQYGCMLHDLC